MSFPFYDGIQKLRDTGDAFQYGGPHLCADGNSRRPTAKRISESSTCQSNPLRARIATEASARLFVSTRRGKQFNTLIYDEIDPLTGAARDAVFINPDDAASLHLSNNDPVALVNDLGKFEGRVFLAPIARGNLQVHWPEANHIIHRGIKDAMGGVPDYNAIVTIEKR